MSAFHEFEMTSITGEQVSFFLINVVSFLNLGLAGFVADALDRNIPLIYAFCGLGVFLLLPVLVLSRPFHAMMAIDVAEKESNEAEHLRHPDDIGGKKLDPGRA